MVCCLWDPLHCSVCDNTKGVSVALILTACLPGKDSERSRSAFPVIPSFTICHCPH